MKPSEPKQSLVRIYPSKNITGGGNPQQGRKLVCLWITGFKRTAPGTSTGYANEKKQPSFAPTRLPGLGPRGVTMQCRQSSQKGLQPHPTPLLPLCATVAFLSCLLSRGVLGLNLQCHYETFNVTNGHHIHCMSTETGTLSDVHFCKEFLFHQHQSVTLCPTLDLCSGLKSFVVRGLCP